MEIVLLTIILVVIALLSGYLSSAGFKGALGEKHVSSIFHRNLDENYHILNDVILPTHDGTTQIDHIIVSIFGVFVVETKNMKGWIFGSARHRKWTQVIYKEKFSFYNPLHQNYKHLMTIKNLIAINKYQIFSLVVFVGDCQLKTELPENVTYGKEVISYIKSKKEVVLNKMQIKEILNKLNSCRLENTRENKKIHINNVKNSS